MKLKEAVELQKEALLKTLQESIRRRSVEDTPAEDAPYGMGIRDCLDHTELVMKQDYIFRVIELAIQAEREAEKVGFKR